MFWHLKIFYVIFFFFFSHLRNSTTLVQRQYAVVFRRCCLLLMLLRGNRVVVVTMIKLYVLVQTQRNVVDDEDGKRNRLKRLNVAMHISAMYSVIGR